jgi:hypothetical protein
MYDYHFQEPLGPASSKITPEFVMAKFIQNFKRVFPFPITGCNSLYNGVTCTLNRVPILFDGVGKVKVFDVNATSFSFVVERCSRYFDPPGSVIRFWISEENTEYFHFDQNNVYTGYFVNKLFLNQHGKANHPGIGSFLEPFMTVFASLDWNQQARNLSSLPHRTPISNNTNLVNPNMPPSYFPSFT